MMMPRRLLHSAHIAVGVLAMLVVALSSDLPAFQESDPHPVSFVCPIDTKLNV